MKRLSVLLITLLLCVGCSTNESEPAPTEKNEVSGDSVGTLSFVANGEDFVRQGFVTKDGWHIEFQNLYVTLADVTAYQTNPPYDAASGEPPKGQMVSVAGPITLDLAAGDTDASPILIDSVEASAGQYNAFGWRMVPAKGDATGDDTTGIDITGVDITGATISLVGIATKSADAQGDETVNFILNDATEYAYNCGEYVGDSRKGIVDAGGAAEVEATFHFDHLFGDADTPADDALNVGALGFEPLAALAENGVLETTVADLADQLDATEYTALVDALAGLGHVGEGHCYEAAGGYTGHSE